MSDGHSAYAPFSVSCNDTGEIVVTYRYYGFKSKQMECAHVAITVREAIKLGRELDLAISSAENIKLRKSHESPLSDFLEEDGNPD